MPSTRQSASNRPTDRTRGQKPLWLWAALACGAGLVVAFLLMRGGSDFDFYRGSTEDGVAATAAGPEFTALPGPGTEPPEVGADSGIDLESILGKSSTDNGPYTINEPATRPELPPTEVAAPTTAPATATASGPRNALPKSIPSASPPPEYPRESLQNQETGMVRVRATVDPQGNVVNTKLEVSSGHRLLDRAAVDAVRGWRFTPAMRDGELIQSDVIVPIEFSL